MAAPIALFTYARAGHTQRTVEALLRNAEAAQSDLIVFSDAARTPEKRQAVDEVRRYVSGIRGFRSVTVYKRERNYGLARSIVEGVTQTLHSHESVIVVEDDILTSPFFLRYMNDALERYAGDERVISIHGYMFPVKVDLPEAFFLPGADCWGWATWRRGWKLFEPDGGKLLKELNARQLTQFFDFNGSHAYSQMLVDQIAGRNDSWAVRWYASALLAGKLTLYPGRSLVHNTGNDGSGTHSAETGSLDVQLAGRPIDLSGVSVVENLECRRAVEVFFRESQPSVSRKLKQRAQLWAARILRRW